MDGNNYDRNAQPPAAQRATRTPPFGGLWSMGIAVTLALFFASTMPQPFFIPVFGELLFFGALGAVLVAVIRREAIWSRRMTAWDQAALLAIASLFVGLFVDVESVIAALEERALAQ